MKSISFWAKENPRKAQISIVFLYIILNLVAITAGLLLLEMDILLSNSVFNIAFILFIVATWMYKRKAKYIYRKTLDLFLISSTFIMICFWGNKTTQGEYYLPLSTKTATGIAFNPSKISVSESRIVPQNKTITKKEFRKSIRKMLKAGALKADPWLKALLILGVVAVGIFAIYLIGLLSCNISCSGAEGLAIVVLVLGLVGVILGGYFLIRSILGKNKSGKKNPSETSSKSDKTEESSIAH